MSNSYFTKVNKYIIDATCITPLHIGSSSNSKEEILVHPVSGEPFIQASSLAGNMRSISQAINSEEVTNKLFGFNKIENANSSQTAGCLKILDGQFYDDSKLSMEYRPHVAINPDTGAVSEQKKQGTYSTSGQKFNMELIGAGAKFRYIVYLTDTNLSEAFHKILGVISSGNVQLGGQTRNGNGFIKAEKILVKEFDLTSPDGRYDWANEESLDDSQFIDIANKISICDDIGFKYSISIHCKTEGDLLVKGLSFSQNQQGKQYTENIANAKGEYIIPGSSIKGSLRSRARFISDKIGVKGLARIVFGDSDSKSKGIVVVKDSVVTVKKDDIVERHRIHIDKFTGGVIDGSLFTEKNIFGDFNIDLFISNSLKSDLALALLVFVLRDLGAGLMNLGSGYSVGKGFLEIDSIVIKELQSGKQAVLYPKAGKIEDPNSIIAVCMSALKEAEV